MNRTNKLKITKDESRSKYKKKTTYTLTFSNVVSDWRQHKNYRKFLKCPSWVSNARCRASEYCWEIPVLQNPLKTILYSLLQNVTLQARVHLMVSTCCFSTILSSFSLQIVAQRVSGIMDKTRWTKFLVCSFLWFKSLRFSFLCLWMSEVYWLCYRSQWHPGPATITNT
jgi:hypothetical protein